MQPLPEISNGFYIDDTGIEQHQKIGYVSPESVEKHQLENVVNQQTLLTISAPRVKLNSAYVLKNDVDEQFAKAAKDLQEAIAQIPQEERMAYASVLWHRSEGMGIVLRAFTPELCQQLQQLPEMELRGIQRPTNEAGQIPGGEYVVRFSEYSYTSDFSQRQNTSASVAIVMEDGSEKQFGAISDTSMRMPKGSLAKALIETMPCGKLAKMQVIEKLESVVIAPESDRHTLTSQEARDWYTIARGNNDLPLAENISVLGSALQHYYNQEQRSEGDRKPPGHYSHPSVTISQEERQQMENDCAHALSVGEAREWYGIAKLKGDQPLVDRIEALGTALQQYYNQEQGDGGQIKPPANYSHPAVTISPEERQQMEGDRVVWREAMIPKPQAPKREAIVL